MCNLFKKFVLKNASKSSHILGRKNCKIFLKNPRIFYRVYILLELLERNTQKKLSYYVSVHWLVFCMTVIHYTYI